MLPGTKESTTQTHTPRYTQIHTFSSPPHSQWLSLSFLFLTHTPVSPVDPVWSITFFSSEAPMCGCHAWGEREQFNPNLYHSFSFHLSLVCVCVCRCTVLCGEACVHWSDCPSPRIHGWNEKGLKAQQQRGLKPSSLFRHFSRSAELANTNSRYLIYIQFLFSSRMKRNYTTFPNIKWHCGLCGRFCHCSLPNLPQQCRILVCLQHWV